jgi:hypothetical protein
LQVQVGQRFAWTDFMAAYAQVQQHGVVGKAVLLVGSLVNVALRAYTSSSLADKANG